MTEHDRRELPDRHPPVARSGPSLAKALFGFLETHRGQMFCTQCLAASLGTTARLDRAVIRAEGRGAQRRYTKCAKCGQDRLVCGFLAR